ncbi:hypothetical protein H6796_00475 [Candidatus Nomurabacteria bacterium]|nr:hypothetical protein [Candidatus Nomurabacteria bacterium]
MSKEDSQTIASQISELDKLVSWFDGDDFALDEAVDKIKAAEELTNSIEDRLVNLRNTVEVLKKDFSKE